MNPSTAGEPAEQEDQLDKPVRPRAARNGARAARATKAEVKAEIDPDPEPDLEILAGPGLDEPPTEQPLPEGRYLNRELSWLDFNARVLTLAEDPATPLLERAKFLAIFSNNLDEFYMVRVAGLKRRQQTGLPVQGPDGLSPREQLALIAGRTA